MRHAFWTLSIAALLVTACGGGQPSAGNAGAGQSQPAAGGQDAAGSQPAAAGQDAAGSQPAAAGQPAAGSAADQSQAAATPAAGSSSVVGDVPAPAVDSGGAAAPGAAAPAAAGAPAGGALPGTAATGPEQTFAEGLKYMQIKAGTGPSPQPGQTVQVHYTGYLTDGTKFDSSVDRGQPLAFPLGQGMVIKGWDVGIAKMKVGEKGKLIVSPEMGYGAAGNPPVIPPNATLVFDVELVAVQ